MLDRIRLIGGWMMIRWFCSFWVWCGNNFIGLANDQMSGGEARHETKGEI